MKNQAFFALSTEKCIQHEISMDVYIELLDALFCHFFILDSDRLSLTKFAHFREFLPFFLNICAIKNEQVGSETSDHHLNVKSVKGTLFGV